MAGGALGIDYPMRSLLDLEFGMAMEGGGGGGGGGASCNEYMEDLSGGFAGVSAGTTIIACTFKGGVVMGADTRTSAGDLVVNKCSRKITRIHDRIFVCRSGSAADTQAIAAIAKPHIMLHALIIGKPPTVNTASRLLQSTCYKYKSSLTAGLIVAGWDEHRGGQIYSIPLGGTRLPVAYASGGSGSAYSAGYMEAKYRDDMTMEECKQFVKECVAIGILKDCGSGGMVRLVTVTKDAVVEECVTGNDIPFSVTS